MTSVAVLRGGTAAGQDVRERGGEHAQMQELVRTADLTEAAAPTTDLGYYVTGGTCPAGGSAAAPAPWAWSGR